MADTLPTGFPSPYHFDMALLEPVHYMMHKGVRIDQKKKAEYSRKYHARWEAKQGKLNAITPYDELNVYSSKQIKEWLYDYLNLPVRKYKGKPTTREDKLRNLMSLCHRKVKELKTDKAKDRWLRGMLSIMLILQIRGLRKRIGNYIDIDIDPDFRMRCTLSVGGTETGRFSSSKTLWDTGCNMQTIPHELRGMFIADDGKELGEFDLNRGESWIYSHLSEDPVMMEIHQEGRDFHAVTAEVLSRHFSDREWTAEEIHIGAKETGNEEAYKLRYLGKRCNHAFAYRMGPHRAMEVINSESDDTGITVRVKDTKIAQKLWTNKYIGIPQWWDDIENQLNENRQLVTPFGRRRKFFESWGSDLFKEATAYVPQSTSVDYLNCGMLRVFHELVKPGKYGIELLHQNHDSILVQWDEGKRDEAISAIRERMKREISINGHPITIPIEPEFGHNWGDLREYDEVA